MASTPRLIDQSRQWLTLLRSGLRREPTLTETGMISRLVLPVELMPSNHQRELLTTMAESIWASLTVGNPDDEDRRRGVVIAKLFGTLASDRVPDDISVLRMAVWLEALDDQPAALVEAAARAWIRCEDLAEGEAMERRAFAPRPAELLRLIWLNRERREADLLTIHRALEAVAAEAPA